ncbi:Histone-lysine N-methyltransferase ASHR2 [Cardamine amara subsp. amara]|uniref:Histone-lysine N-methyltransferase ASHR2 n=1 Tax=Cardamine amara subsp. amara TaxID=228776 RepID=A0ABD1BUB7_CARAN
MMSWMMKMGKKKRWRMKKVTRKTKKKKKLLDDESSFPHAYFFVRHMCEKENCFGTLAPLPPKTCDASKVLECNVCGSLKEDEVGRNQ